MFTTGDTVSLVEAVFATISDSSPYGIHCAGFFIVFYGWMYLGRGRGLAPLGWPGLL